MANTGLTLYGDFFECTPKDFDRVTAMSLRGTFLLAQAAAREMRKQGTGGRILLLSSVTGHRSIRSLAAYGMTKAAIEMIARSLVVELSPFGITINAIAPGATVTPRTLAEQPDFEEVWSRVTPLGKPASVGDIAEAASSCSPLPPPTSRASHSWWMAAGPPSARLRRARVRKLRKRDRSLRGNPRPKASVIP